jgi:hypothetical protein
MAESTAHPSEVVELPPDGPVLQGPATSIRELGYFLTQENASGQPIWPAEPLRPAGQTATPVSERVAHATRTLRSDRLPQQKFNQRVEHKGKTGRRQQTVVKAGSEVAKGVVRSKVCTIG